MKLRSVLIIVAVAAIGLAGGLAMGHAKARRDASVPFSAAVPVALGSAAPPLSAVFFGEPAQHFSLTDLRGKPVLVDFFASWCPPCLAVAPVLHALVETHRDDLYAISVSVDHDHAAPRLKTWPTSAAMPLLLADDGVDVAWGIDLLPTILLIDADGVIRSGNLMRIDPAATKAAIETALADLPTSRPTSQPIPQPTSQTKS